MNGSYFLLSLSSSSSLSLKDQEQIVSLGKEFQEERTEDFPGGPVKTCLITVQGTKMPHAVLHGQKRRKKRLPGSYAVKERMRKDIEFKD